MINLYLHHKKSKQDQIHLLQKKHLFWNVLYFANGDFQNWVGVQFLAALYTFLSTMALGMTVVYIIYVTAKLSGFLDKIRSTKDPRRDVGHQ